MHIGISMEKYSGPIIKGPLFKKHVHLSFQKLLQNTIIFYRYIKYFLII